LLDEGNHLKLPILNEKFLPAGVSASGPPDPEFIKILWAKASARNLELNKEKHATLAHPSETQMENILQGAQGAWEDYVQGGRLKSKLPFVGEVLQSLVTFSPARRSDEYGVGVPKWLRNQGLEIPLEKIVNIINCKCKPSPEELLAFCKALKLKNPEKTVQLLENLPVSAYVTFGHSHPGYVLAHPEHYETFGLWLKGLRESSGQALEDVSRRLNIVHATLSMAENQKADQPFTAYCKPMSIPENILATDPYHCFPQGNGAEALAFRKKFRALAEPGVMTAQYNEARQWITKAALLEALPLKWDRSLHAEVLSKWHAAETQLKDKISDFTFAGTVVKIRRDEEGEMRFHRSALDILRANPIIQDHISRQQKPGYEQGI
jgi:hypothetical protein